MQKSYLKIVARQINEAVFEIYGNLGETVNGNYLASQINSVGKTSDILTFRINSMGGSLAEGLSVIGAIIGSPAETNAVIEGIAGSMSGIIALSCRKIKMNDYARLMLHAPFFVDDNGDARTDLNDDEKSTIKNFRDQLTDLLSRRGKSKKDISAILEKDTWYTAQEALAAGFIDEIIDTGVSNLTSGMSIEKLVAFVNEKALTINTDMKKIAAKLGLPESSDEQAILTAIDQKETSLADTRKKLVDAVIAAGKKSGTVNDSNVASMTKLGNADLDLLVDLVIRPVEKEDKTRLSDILAKVDEVLAGKEPGKKDEKDWDWYQKNDPIGLQKMKISDKGKYQKLYDAYWGGLK